MNTSTLRYCCVIGVTLVIGILAVSQPASAAVDYASFAALQADGSVLLRAITFNTSPNDRGVVASMGVRANRYTGPGYNYIGAWKDDPLDADIVVVITERSSNLAGRHCVAGQHRWVIGNVTNLRSSTQKCVNKSGGGCAIANPQTSILSLSGELTALSGSAQTPLTRRGVAEDTRSIVLDEYALAYVGSHQASFKHVSEDFQVTPVLVNALTSQSSPRSQPQQASESSLTAVELSARGDSRRFTAASRAALVIEHQREHPANERFAPLPSVTFMPQTIANPLVEEERRGFAIVDFGESGRILHLDTISENAVPAGSEIVAAISTALSTQFSDGRRHDHRVYLAYEVRNQTLIQLGTPLVTAPMCCRPEPCNPRCP